MKGVEVALSCLAGLGTLLVFFGTMALLGECIETSGYIAYFFENCQGLIEYKDYTNQTKYIISGIPCNSYDIGLRMVPITYSIWSTESGRVGYSLIPYNTAIYLFKTGIITLFLSVPGIVAIRWKNNL